MEGTVVNLSDTSNMTDEERVNYYRQMLSNLSFPSADGGGQIGSLAMEEDYFLERGIYAMPAEISILLLIFVFLFVVGFFGNITVIYRIMQTQKQCEQVYGKSRRVTLQRYVIFLATVDLLVTTMILMLLPFFFYGEWLLGDSLCKMFWITDQINKILSIHVLSGMAIERYFIVRHSVHCRRSAAPRIATCTFFCVTGICLLCLLPLLANVHVNETTMIEGRPDSVIKSCNSPLPDDTWIEVFSLTMFFFGYCIPAIIVTFCYTMLVHMLRKRYELNSKPENSKTRLVHRVSKSILYVTAFHFACWTPFWIVTILPILDHRWLHFDLRRNPIFVKVQFFNTALPYVNCSFNWCFYVLLNQRLRHQIFRRSSTHLNTTKREDHSPFFAHDAHEL